MHKWKKQPSHKMTSALMSVRYLIPPFMFKVEYIIKMDGNIEPNLMEHKSQELPRVAM
jgi:hypothetical protein